VDDSLDRRHRAVCSIVVEGFWNIAALVLGIADIGRRADTSQRSVRNGALIGEVGKE
jgi:hypothetical protein